MDGDIDIEEHDVLDNPTIRSIFPDLSVIKKEIDIFNEDASSSGTDAALPKSTGSVENWFRRASKDQGKQVSEDLEKNIKSHVTSTLIPSYPNEIKGQSSNINKIILGSKPFQQIQHVEKTYEKNIKPLSAQLILNDIGSFLYKSDKFCTVCNILFSQKTDLKNHKAIYHSKIYKINKSLNCTVRAQQNGSFKCELCLRIFSKIWHFERHLKCSHKQLSLNKIKLSNKKYGYHLSVHQKVDEPKTTTLSPKINAYKIKSKSDFGNACFHCKKKFPSKKSLIEHIYKILQSSSSINNEKQQVVKENKDNAIPKSISSIDLKKVNKEPLLLYKCYYCSYYFINKKNYVGHLFMKHKESDLTYIKKVEFDPNCTFCSAKSGQIVAYNRHLQKCHETRIKNTFKIKPKLCIPKVDLTLSMSHNHEIINDTRKERIPSNTQVSKRKISNKLSQSIKKRKEVNITKSDKVDNARSSHSQMLVLKSVLFKCTRCDIHFLSAKSAMNHLDHMEMLINWKCLCCQRIFKKNDEPIHNTQHSFSNEFTVYELNESQLSRVLYKCSKCAIHFNDDNYASHFQACGFIIPESTYCKECDILVERKFMQHHEYEHKTKLQSSLDFTIVNSDVMLINSSKVNRKTKKKNVKKTHILNKMCYCEACKCFVAKVTIRDIHKKGQCTHMEHTICKDCGLVLTKQSFKCHKKRHKIQKGLKLQDFTFYDLNSGKKIYPHIPEYPKCKSCNVHFLSKKAILYHVCKKGEFLTCPVCEIKLSDKVFKLHVAFHNYSLNHNNKSLLHDAVLGGTENKKNKSTKSLAIVQNLKPGEATINSNHNQRKIAAPTQKVDEEIAHHSNELIREMVQSDIITEEQIAKPLKKHSVESTELSQFAYCCASCYITYNKFDEAVEHCQDHYNDINFELFLKQCNICKLKYDERFYAEHNALHGNRLGENFLNLLKFDIFYFLIDFKHWIKNLFESVEPQKVEQILDHAIYKYEGRIKLRVIQEGSSDLIVYKCNSCRVYIDPDTIFSHCENFCLRQRIHPCSFCGLPFISDLSRLTHEILHKQSSGISFKSYKIVTFDREKDHEYIKKIISSRRYFVFYQCRICNGIFERFQNRKHVCNKLNLKKCSTCDLNFYSHDYKSHVLKHTIFENFTQKNMRIIFFQHSNENVPSNGLPSTFKGIVSDYTFYKCTGCGLCCTKLNSHPMSNHDCGVTKEKCIKCELYIQKKYITKHKKQHDSDPYFAVENFNFLPLLPLHKKQNDFVPADSTSKICEIIDEDMGTEELIVSENISNDLTKTLEEMNWNETDSISEKVAKIYKCACGLHFLDINSIRSHFGHCASRISKQKCSKCNLLFTPKELFTHLIRHHGDKNNVYKMNIIEMSQNKNEIINLYKCSKCNVNFIENEKANQHFVNCQNSEQEKKICNICNSYFDISSIDAHKNTHHADNVADYEIIEITDQLNPDKRKLAEYEIESLISEADAVCGSSYNLSPESLAQIKLGIYSNVIYKCEECNLHFLIKDTLRRHTCRHQPFDSQIAECNICGLNFSLSSLSKHVYIHHRHMKLDLSSLVIES